MGVAIGLFNVHEAAPSVTFSTAGTPWRRRVLNAPTGANGRVVLFDMHDWFLSFMLGNQESCLPPGGASGAAHEVATDTSNVAADDGGYWGAAYDPLNVGDEELVYANEHVAIMCIYSNT
jgi:hypothetical protein